MVMDSVYRSEPSSPMDDTHYFTPAAEATRRTDSFSMPILPPIFIPSGQAPLPPVTGLRSISGDEKPSKDPSRERITCLRCKEYSINCHGPEIKLDGHCSICHEKGKKCEFESRASDQNLDAPLSSPNPQSPAINDEMLHQTVRTSNDNRTNIKIPDPQPDISSSSSSRQSYQNPPIKDPSRDTETANSTHGFTDDHSISGEPRIKPWWKRLFSRIFFSRKDRGAKRKRRS